MFIASLTPVRQYLANLGTVVGSGRTRIPSLIAMFLVVSLMDLVGIGLAAPFVTVVINPDLISSTLPDYLARLLPRNQMDQLAIIGGGLVAIFIFKGVVAAHTNGRILHFAAQIDQELRVRLMRSYQCMPYEDYLARNSSEYIHTVQVLAYHAVYLGLVIILRMMAELIVLTAIVIFLATRSAEAVGLLVGMLLFFSVFFIASTRRISARYGRQSAESGIRLVKSIRHGIDGLKEIRILGKEARFLDGVFTAAKDFSHCQQRTQFIALLPRYGLEIILVTFVVMLCWMSIGEGQASADLIPMLGMLAIAGMRALPSVGLLLGGMSNLQFSRAAVERIGKELSSEKKRVETHESTSCVDDFHDFSLNDVCYTYPGADKTSLSNVSLSVVQGEAIGVIGPSGAGKSTLLDVMLGLLPPQGGEFRLNGKLIDQAKMAAWLAHVAYIPQVIFVIDDSIRRNVALGVRDDEVNDEKVYEALRQARLIEFVKELPSGIDTEIGERGVRLSGGQRQRIALARAFYHDRQVIIMDEATSALDSDTEREIVDEIRQLRGKKTLIVIAHRLSTVEHCDKVYRLESGRVTHCATLSEIINAVNQKNIA